METLCSDYGDVSVDANARTIRLAATTGSGATLRFCATGSLSPGEDLSADRRLAVIFLTHPPLGSGDDMSAYRRLILGGGDMPGYRGSFGYDLPHFRSAGDDVLQDIDWMLAVSGVPPECAAAVEYFCTLTAGIAAADHWTGASVVVMMPESRSYVRVETVKYGEAAAGGLREEACGICFEEFVEGVEVGRMQCSHAYHEKCLRQWLDQKHSCPYCRAPVQP